MEKDWFFYGTTMSSTNADKLQQNVKEFKDLLTSINYNDVRKGLIKYYIIKNNKIYDIRQRFYCWS
jgi:hypothetical protein